MATNTSGVHNLRSNRSNMNGDRGRGQHGNGFGAGNTNFHTIWSDSNRVHGFGEDQPVTDSRYEGKSGSGSLLSTSESEGWAGRPHLPWSTVNTTGLPMSQGRTTMATSPVQVRGSDGNAATYNDTGDSSYFSLPRTTSMNNSSGSASHRPYLHSGSEGASPSGDGVTFNAFGGLRNGDGRRQISSSALGGSPVGTTFPVKSGFASALDNSRSEDVAMGPLGSGMADGTSPTQTRNTFSEMRHNSTTFVPQRPAHTARTSYYSDNHTSDSRYNSSSIEMGGGFSKLQVNDNGHHAHTGAQRPSIMSQASFDGSLARAKTQNVDDFTYQALATYGAQAAHDLQFGYQGRAHGGDQGSGSPTSYGHVSTAMYTDAEAAQLRNAAQLRMNEQLAFERRLSAYQEQEFMQAQGNGMPRMTIPPSYEFQNYQAARLNALQGYYPIAQIPQIPGLNAAALASRAQRDQDPSQSVRSPLLEEFRANNKGSKRYELKDIYGHVVEFSGDQHGSRFIQQKLETANSDEKEQVFREIQENALQLMTDVFGNYVVQKLFEHGNQSQKKILANQMRGHVLALSTQMYGCRVVQKALEHILTDQQAAMVKELENHVLKCVRDQNGNHVIQKAIERVPSQYVQFIIDAFRGQVHRHAAHPYGCRVIQRMLEHCTEFDRESILSELHACTLSLIPDQFGNYVIQHVIENGEAKDRDRMIQVVMSQLLAFSKHKFASNVVEKSIEFGDESQRHYIITTLTSSNDRGENPLLGLMRDQYGNYVIQKVLGQLKGAEREALVEQIKPLLSQLKKFSYGKQIVAIEKLIFDTTSPMGGPMTQGSTTPPNSHKSSPQPPKRRISAVQQPQTPYVTNGPPTPPPTDSHASMATFESKGLCRGTVTSVSSPDSGSNGVSIHIDGH
ncbi:hypothetical protein PDE_03566 [Penicillium oxalicum 114-2]|uniref:Pumilio homology domain family member 3 n=1 Tax=Penicillium oxalicum (strain 114-2 / CGMCC 5302) TaxID=933388 RepID=S7ZD93_PENO1|nr:hypothetical protein PDE_03566 [Penicillium oxalicum 114-2]